MKDDETEKELDKKQELEYVLSKEEQAALAKISGGEWGKYTRVAMAALSGIPWVGSLIGAAATLSAENAQQDVNKVMFLWVQEHEVKLRELGLTLKQVFERFESFGDRIKERIESEEYISLVRKTFWLWDHMETMEKKEMLRKLITNAGGVAIVQDDWVRMFLEWIEKYNELHFRVIAEVHNHPNITRKNIWLNIKGNIPKDNSAEADVFKLLMDDLTTGRVIRQYRETNEYGEFYKQSRKGVSRAPSSDVMKSPFDDEDPYVLTELGQGFVRYVLSELTTQIGEEN